MSNPAFRFDHVHLISRDPNAAALWYEEMFGASVTGEFVLRGAPQITVDLGETTIIIRGQRPGENPVATGGIVQFDNYASHNEWGTDHFGFTYQGDLVAFCEELRAKGVSFAVEPWEFSPGSLLCYVCAPDGVSIELLQG